MAKEIAASTMKLKLVSGQDAKGEIAPLYSKVPDVVYRVDTVALEAA